MSGHIESFAFNAQRLGISMAKFLSVSITVAVTDPVAAFDQFDNAMVQSLAIMGNVGERNKHSQHR